MSDSLKFYKVLSLPKVLVPNAIYLVAEKKSDTVQIVVANKEGDGVLRTVNESHIRSIIRDELFSPRTEQKSYKKIIIYIILIIILVICFMCYLKTIPIFSAYEIKSIPIERTIHARGYVENVPIKQVTSKTTGLVREVKVKNNENVHSKHTLLTFQSSFIVKQINEIENQLNAINERKKQEAKLQLQRAGLELIQAKYESKRHHPPIVSKEESERFKTAWGIAEKNLKLAELKEKTVNLPELEELKLSLQLSLLKTELSESMVLSEVDGKILSSNVKAGDFVKQGSILFTMAYSGDTKIKIYIDERDLSKIGLQQQVKVVADAYPDQPFPAKISFISPIIDPQRSQIEVWLEIDKAPQFLLQNMKVSIEIKPNSKEGQHKKALMIPNSAITHVFGNRANVILVEHSKIKHKKVLLGFRGHLNSEVISGLTEGDKVLTEISTLLKDGDRIRIKKIDNLFQ